MNVIVKRLAACRKDPCSCRISIVFGLMLTYLAVFSIVSNKLLLPGVTVLIGLHIVWELSMIIRLVRKNKIGHC